MIGKYRNTKEFVNHFVNKLPCIKDCYKRKQYNQHFTEEAVPSSIRQDMLSESVFSKGDEGKNGKMMDKRPKKSTSNVYLDIEEFGHSGAMCEVNFNSPVLTMMN